MIICNSFYVQEHPEMIECHEYNEMLPRSAYYTGRLFKRVNCKACEDKLMAEVRRKREPIIPAGLLKKDCGICRKRCKTSTMLREGGWLSGLVCRGCNKSQRAHEKNHTKQQHHDPFCQFCLEHQYHRDQHEQFLKRTGCPF